LLPKSQQWKPYFVLSLSKCFSHLVKKTWTFLFTFAEKLVHVPCLCSLSEELCFWLLLKETSCDSTMFLFVQGLCFGLWSLFFQFQIINRVNI
jgi:hypothetical protein